MARPRLFGECPECGAATLRVTHANRRGVCVVRYVVCSRCGYSFRMIVKNFFTRKRKKRV